MDLNPLWNTAVEVSPQVLWLSLAGKDKQETALLLGDEAAEEDGHCAMHYWQFHHADLSNDNLKVAAV